MPSLRPCIVAHAQAIIESHPASHAALPEAGVFGVVVIVVAAARCSS